MGYYTEYKVAVVSGDADLHEVAAALEEASNYSFDILSRTAEAVTDRVKWYHHEDDLKAVSLQFPDSVIEVEGVGEDYPDIWVQRFHNGVAGEKIKAVISFPGLT